MSEQSEHDQQEGEVDVVRKHVAALGEHFDSVQVFAVRYDAETGGTIHICIGAGDYYSRVGVTESWLIREKEAIRQDDDAMEDE